MPIKIHEFADHESVEAIEWYELQAKGLGNKFKNAVIGQIEKIKKIQLGF